MNTKNFSLNASLPSYPLSSSQLDIWFDQMLQPDIPFYNIAGYLQITGPVDHPILEQAINQVIQENDALRLIFFLDQNQLPRQQIQQSVSFSLDYYDFSTQDNPHQSALDWMQQTLKQPFVLYHHLLFDFALCKISVFNYYLFYCCHHLIVDGWATSLIAQRITMAYNAIINKDPVFDSPKYSYLDFLEDDQTYRNSTKWQRDSNYWQAKYQTPPAYTSLIPRRYTIHSKQAIPNQLACLTLPRPFYNQLLTLAQSLNSTIFRLMLAVFYCYFVRVYDQQELIIGLSTLNRNKSSFKKTLGLFSSANPTRLNFGTQLNFIELLQAIDKELRQQYRHQRFPLREINNLLPFLPAGQQLFDIIFSYEKLNDTTLFNGHVTQTVALQYGFERNALAIFIRECHETEDVKIDFDYHLSAFQPDEIELLKSRIFFILNNLSQYLTQPIFQTPLLPEAERQRLLIEFNETATALPPHQTIVALFEAQVAKTPTNIAVVYQSEHLTYQELNTRANRLAHYLRNQGVQPEVIVGICLERSFDLIIGLLAILKAGGAYLPLDPNYPTHRLSFMLNETQAPILLTQQKFLNQLPSVEHQMKIICLDNEELQLITKTKENEQNFPLSEVQPHHLAYVIYTSGSTGQPKGVMISHGSLVNFLITMSQQPGLTAQDNVLAISTISFDIAGFELYGPLIIGAKIILVSHEVAQAGKEIWENIIQNEVTIVQATVSSWRLLLATEKMATNNQFKKLKKMLCGGEVLSHQLAKQLLKKLGDELWNLYGPTEVTVCSTRLSVEKWQVAEEIEMTVPIGNPVANIQTFILDHHFNLVPIGIPGELHIGGIGLARGYRNRPELTAEKFIPNPFSQQPGTRLYKTGDLARYLPNGNIEYLGRIDHQVKIRGFRIELGEIEAVLETHPTVQKSVVISHQQETDNKRLIAYIISSPSQPFDPQALRRFLQERLPDYMIPQAWLSLETLPLTSSGKIDRQALEKVTIDDFSSKKTFITPRNPIEEELLALWADVLGLESLGIHDDFFELGGHSLLATQIISRIRDTFDVEIQLRQLFETTTIANLAKQIENLHQQIERPPIQPVTREQPLALSFAQQRLWFIDQFEGRNNVLYNMPAALHLSGYLNVIALKQTLREIIRRHETLRTQFPHQDGIPYQAIQTASTMPDLLPVIDLAILTKEQQKLETQRLINQEAMQPFDLVSGPLFRATLLQLGAKEQVLLLTMHHIISDGWSMGILVKELNLLYEAFSQKRASPLSPLSIQYADYAHWQRQWLTGEVLDNQVTYWQQQLAQAPALLELPTDRPRPAVQTFRGHTIYFTIAPEWVKPLKILSRQNSATLFMTLHAAFITLLSRYSGQEHIVVGSPIANRTMSEIEPLIGFFVNTLVLHTDLSDNPTFQQLLLRVRQDTLNAYLYQDLPFEQLVEVLKLTRNLSYNPLFQVMLAFQNAPMEEIDLAGLTTTFLSPENQIARFDLTLSLTEKDEQLNGYLEYNLDLFDTTTIQRMIEHFQVLLESIVHHPQQRINELPLLTTVEQQQLLAWNQTQTDYPKERCIHQLFEAQVEKTPTNIAVVYQSEHLTYQELNTRANRLAHYLRNQGVQPEVIVGICLERSFDLIVGLLAILKAGGAYLPLDFSYPQARLTFMLEDAQISIILTQEKWLAQLPISCNAICLERDSQLISRYPTDNPNNNVQANHLAYVMYTSGSTGKPKGVEIAHRGLVNLTYTLIPIFKMQTGVKLLQFASLNFDVATSDFTLTLCSGAILVIIPSTKALFSNNSLVHTLRSQEITHLQIPPSVLEKLPHLATFTSLQAIIVAGEACPANLATYWSKGRSFFNAYGPTEATIYATFTQCIDDNNKKNPPIGLPLANIQTYILDRFLQPLPISIPGELHIGGIGLARGYRNHPELTAEKFIPNPFSQQPGTRLYKTGDLARYLPDGNIEYLGRLDHQVKIHGFRIELGEIEAVLAQYERVQEVVVMAQEDHSGDKRLVAYLVPNFLEERFFYQTDCLCEVKGHSFSWRTQDFSAYGFSLDLTTVESDDYAQLSLEPEQTVTVTLTLPGDSKIVQLSGQIHQWNASQMIIHFSPTSSEGQRVHQAFLWLLTQHNYLVDVQRQMTHLLPAQLKQQLPGYMIPTLFIALLAFPLTPNGKIDRQALPAPQAQRLSAEDYVAPRTPTEQLLADIWAEVLEVTPVSIHDNFFELGGDSILSIQVTSRANQNGIPLTPRLLFNHQSIAELVTILTDSTQSLTLSTAMVSGQIPLTPIQHWFFAQELADVHHFNQAILLTGPGSDSLKLSLLEASLQAVITHHDGLWSRFVRQETLWQQTILPAEEDSSPTWFSVIDLSNQPTKQLAPGLFKQLQASLDLAAGPLMRVVFVDVGSEGYLLWIIHYLVIDAVSWRILLADFIQAYQQLSSGQAIELLPKTTSIKTYSQKLLESAYSDTLAKELTFWQSQVDNSRLPVDTEEPASENLVATAQVLQTALSATLTDALLHQVPSAYHTQINDVLLTALLQAFAGWTGQDHLLVLVEGDGRDVWFEEINLTRTVGWFTNVYPVLLKGKGQLAQPGEALKTIKEQLHAIPHHGIGYGILRYLRQHVDLRNQPMPQVSFNYLGQLDQTAIAGTTGPFKFQLAQQTIESAHSPRNQRAHLIEINGLILNGQLQMNWHYNQQLHQKSTIQTVAEDFITALETLIIHCQSVETGEYTPSDFPGTQLNQQELDNLFDELDD